MAHCAAEVPYDVIYIDSFYNHRALPDSQTPLTRAEVESLKHKPDGSRRQVIAYLSVGSAETEPLVRAGRLDLGRPCQPEQRTEHEVGQDHQRRLLAA